MTWRKQLGSLLQQIEMKTGGHCSPAVTILLSINTVIFLIALFTGPGSDGRNPVTAALWASEAIWQGEVWRLLSAAFAHEQVMHWFWNMVGLFFFGNFVERHLGSKGLVVLAVCVALISNFVHVAFVSDRPVLGFSGVVYAIIVAFAAIAPKARVLMLVIPMPAWVLAALFVGLNTLQFIQMGNQSLTAYDVHLVGAAIGLIAIRGGFLIRPLLQRWKQHKAQKQSTQIAFDQGELDRLLAKVSAQGLPSLSKSERAFLQRFSKSRQA